MVEMVREVVVHLSRHCLLQYPLYLPITRDFYTPTDLHITFHTPDTYTSLPYPVSPKPAFIAVDITLTSHHLSSPTLPPIGETIVDLVSELGALPARRPRDPRIRRVLHPSVPSALSTPSTPFEIARDPIDQLVVYSRRRPKINIKTSSCGTH